MAHHERLARLTENERICLRHWLQHKSAKEIAVELNISHHAVEKRLKTARTKLDVTSSIEAARMLAAGEGYGHTAPHSSDLASGSTAFQQKLPRTLILGVTAMIVVGILLLAPLVYPAPDAVEGPISPTVAKAYDEQLEATLATMISSAEIGDDGEVFFVRPIGDPQFLQPKSGRYWQVSGEGHGDFTSRSLFDRRLQSSGRKAKTPDFYDSNQFPEEPLRVAERTVILPGSKVEWQFIVARSR
ncbi:helix-turn-helix transcriptional regulator [Parerythrobacter aurantius]|uniref:helix-turn-helix transcriptional regulator n=1 Tax=Parerythrobacter aurantius TaxID=3127706 RepID=UPI00324F7B9C